MELRTPTLNVAAAVLAVSSLVGCSDREPIEQRVQTAPQAIQGGSLDSTDTAVMGVAHVSGFGFGGCTGSLIFDNVVLTAIHCVASTPQLIECPSQVFNIHPASEMFVTSATSFPQQQSGYHSVREVVVPDGTGLCGRDVAILVLNGPVSPSEAIPIFPRDVPVEENLLYSAVGYGEQGEGGPSGTRMRRDNLSVLCVGNLCGVPDYVYPAEFVGQTGVCSGDSGGPALDAEGRVFGVASRGAAGCDQPVYGNVYTHLDWVKATTVYAASLAGLTPPSWATAVTTTSGPGSGGGAGVGGGGVGGDASAGSGRAAGNLKNQDYKGEIVSSCATAPGPRRSVWGALLLSCVALSWVGRRRRQPTR